MKLTRIKRLNLVLFLNLVFFFSSTVEAKNKYQYNISIMAIFQDEAEYLKEWIDYHALIGVEHFYLYNHNSTDDHLKVLSPYIEKGIVDYTDYSQPGFPQNKAIKDALSKSKGETKWLAVIDIDEFFLPKKHKDLLDFLSNYEDYGGVSVNWQCFGTSYTPYIPPGELMLEHLTFKALPLFEWNSHVKCIVCPERVKDVVNTHCFIYHQPYFAVRPNKAKQAHSHESPIQTDLIVLNHYWTRDENFFYNIKVPRCQKLKGWSREYTESHNNLMNEVEDRVLVEKYIERLKYSILEKTP